MTRYPAAISMIHRNEPYRTACLLFLFSFLFFHVFRIPVPLNVDTYLYARAIESFEGPITHLGYYMIGSLCHVLLGPMDVTPLQTLGYISQFFGSVSVAGIYILTFLLTGSRLHSLLTASILMFSGAFWLFSIHGEVYVPQLAFVLLSLIFLLKTRPLLSSLSILIAVSITPTSLLALVPLCYIMYMKKLDKKRLIYFSTPILLTFVIMMLWDGPRLIETFANAMYSPAIFFDKFSYSEMLTQIVYDLMKAYGRSFNLISFFAIFGLAAMYKKERKLWGLMLAFLVPFLVYFLNLGLFSADHLIISFIAVSLLGSYGIVRLFDIVNPHTRTRFVFITLLLSLYFWLSFEFSIDRQRVYAKELNRVIQTFSGKYQHDEIMLTDFSLGVIFISMSNRKLPFSLFNGDPNRYLMENPSDSKDVLKKLQGRFWVEFGHLCAFASRPEFQSLVDHRPIYLVERIDWPIGFVQLFKELLIDMSLEKPVEQIQRLKNIREYLAYKLDTDITIEKIIDSPLHPVYLMKPVR